ncbi:hypothetical protein KC352_g34584, partial [Hortaea werneckii]
VEDEQRREAAERGEEAWKPKLFKEVPAGDEEKLDWIIDAEVDHTRPVEEQVKQILAIAPILPGQQWGEMAEDVQLPSQQGKPLPPKSPEEEQEGQAQQASGGELIDFGQNDSSSAAQQQQQQGKQSSGAGTKDLEGAMGGMSLGRGNPVRRQDSMGQEDTFIDAES